MVNLNNFFKPKSVAVIGVSRNPKKVGHVLFRILLDGGYQGDVYIVNNGNSEITDVNVKMSIPELDLDDIKTIDEISAKGGKSTEQHHIDIKSLPKILINDSAIESMNLKQGDVVRIERISRTAGTSNYLRQLYHTRLDLLIAALTMSRYILLRLL